MIADYAGKTEITVTDTLPAGAELLTDSVTLRRHPESWNTFTDETQDSYYLQQVHTQKNPDGTTTVTFLIGHLKDLNNDPIGIILCTDKPSTKMEYVLGGLENRIFASKYVLYLPEKKALEDEVQSFIEGWEEKG